MINVILKYNNFYLTKTYTKGQLHLKKMKERGEVMMMVKLSTTNRSVSWTNVMGWVPKEDT